MPSPRLGAPLGIGLQLCLQASNLEPVGAGGHLHPETDEPSKVGSSNIRMLGRGRESEGSISHPHHFPLGSSPMKMHVAPTTFSGHLGPWPFAAAQCCRYGSLLVAEAREQLVYGELCRFDARRTMAKTPTLLIADFGSLLLLPPGLQNQLAFQHTPLGTIPRLLATLKLPSGHRGFTIQ